jgi:hypothetical protein
LHKRSSYTQRSIKNQGLLLLSGQRQNIQLISHLPCRLCAVMLPHTFNIWCWWATWLAYDMQNNLNGRALHFILHLHTYFGYLTRIIWPKYLIIPSIVTPSTFTPDTFPSMLCLVSRYITLSEKQLENKSNDSQMRPCAYKNIMKCDNSHPKIFRNAAHTLSLYFVFL